MLTFGQFIGLVSDMRLAQKDHHAKSSRANRRRRSSLEYQVDTAIAAYRDAPPSPPALDEDLDIASGLD